MLIHVTDNETDFGIIFPADSPAKVRITETTDDNTGRKKFLIEEKDGLQYVVTSTEHGVTISANKQLAWHPKGSFVSIDP